jgi:hypothetical protein
MLAACDPDLRTDHCQYVCDQSHPGNIGTKCEPADICWERFPGYGGDCFCNAEGTCGPGWQPWRPDPEPIPTTCP